MDPDPAAAIHPNNQERVLRALEHSRATARRLSDLLAVQRGILDNISESVLIISPNLKLKSYNVAFLRLWGLGAAELDASPYLRELLDLLKPKLPELEDWNTYRKNMNNQITTDTH